MSFEGLIRPFQSEKVSYQRRVIKADTVSVEPPENVTFQVKGGGSKSLGMSYSGSSNHYMDKVQKEVTRPEEGGEE